MIHYVLLSKNAKYLLACKFEKTVYVWDFQNREFLYLKNTSFETSAERIAISNDELSFVTCSWDKRNIVKYNITDGRIIWANKLISQTHSICFSPDDTKIYVESEKGFFTLDSKDGLILKKESKQIKMYDSGVNDIYILRKSKKYYIYQKDKLITKMDLKSFAELDLCFGNDVFYTTEVANELRCIDIFTGKDIWSVKPTEGTHFLKISYCQEDSIIFAMLYTFETSGNNILFIIDANNGGIIGEYNLNERSAGFCFNSKNKLLILSEEIVYYLDKNPNNIKQEELKFTNILDL